MTVKGAYSIRGENQKPVEPSIKFENNTKITQYLNGMEIAFDPYFTLYGVVEVYADGQKILDQNEIDAFRQYGLYTIPINSKTIRPYSTVEVYVWNPVTDDIVFLSAGVDLDDTAHPSTLSGQAVNNEILLNQIGGGAGDEYDTHDIFPYQIYRNETKEFLINTKGRQNMLLTMASSNVTPPVIIPNSFSILPRPSLDFIAASIRDNSPDETSAITENHIDYTPHIGVYGTHKDGYIETYSIKRYYDKFDVIKYLDGSSLDSKALDSWIDEVIVIDGIDTEAKQLQFDFSNSNFSFAQYTQMEILRAITTYYSRSRYNVIVSSVGNYDVYNSGWSEFSTAKSLNMTATREGSSTTYSRTIQRHGNPVHQYDTPAVLINYDVSILVDACNDEDFSSDIETLTPIMSNGVHAFNTSKRYIRLRRQITPQNPISFANAGSGATGDTGTQYYPLIENSMSIVNLIDLLSHGGTASLSFWLKGVNDQWFELLESEELDAITQGQSKLIRHNIKGIPPSQSRFKAVLQVVGSLKTGVTIDLVA